MKYYLFFLLTAFTLSQIARIETPFGFGIMLLDLLVILTSIPLYFIQSLWKKIEIDLLIKSIGIFLLFCLLSLLINIPTLFGEKMLVSSLYFIRVLSYFSLFLFLRGEVKEKETVEKGILLSGITITALGFAQYFLYPSLRNLYYLGWDEHLHRLFTVFLDPNFAGIFFVLFILFLLSFYQKTKQKRLFVLLGVVLVALFLTYSRTAYVALFIGVGVYAFLEKQGKILLSFILSGILLGMIFFSTFQTDNTNPFRVASSLSRIESVTQGLTIAKDHLFFGVGFNAYRYALDTYGYLQQTDIAINHSESGNSNSFVFVLATTGIFGLFSYLFFLYQFGKRFIQEKKSYLVASLVVLLIGGLFNNALFYTPFLFWIFLLSATENI